MAKTQERNYDGEQDSVNRLGQIYAKIMDFNVITRNLIYILPLSIALAIPPALFATIYANARAGGVRPHGLFIWLEVMWWCLWITKLLAQMLPFVFQFLCGFVSSGTRKYCLVIRALEIPISFMLWSISLWATVPVITVFDHGNTFHWVTTFRKVLLASIAVAALILAEKLIIQLISINYHRRQFNARVNESKHKVSMLDSLYAASVTLFPAYYPEFRNEDYIILTGVDRGNGKNEEANAELIGKLFNPTAAHNVVVDALEMKTSSQALGRRLWLSLVEEGKDALLRQDIYDIMGECRKDEAEDMFNTLDADQNGDISLDEMVMMVTVIAVERKAIARSVHDVGQAVKVLDRFLFAIALIAIGLIYAAFFNSSFSKYLLGIGSQIAAFGFALSTTVTEFIGSCIFLFVNPYDVDDRVLIADVHMVVEHISLLYTQFKRVDNNRVIKNVARSKAMKEHVSVSIHAETSSADIEVLKGQLKAFVIAPENKRDFFPDVEIQIMEVKNLKSIELLVGVMHKSNWANEVLPATRRNKLMTAVMSCLRQVPIYAAGADKPLAILQSTKEVVDAARERIQEDHLIPGNRLWECAEQDINGKDRTDFVARMKYLRIFVNGLHLSIIPIQ
ncbi:hypothetical protein EJ08DRAFT_714208 [Tothia fuscella]|uniref:EF-hand domain-containing protein n=1 Tax=Tothia fuscella TaxID=1048955 RepID=A0A9P4NSF4_9PEZI|nr:hypothetical protein EJ08DRAFT_714208 [Tothia fuscella]